MKRLLCGSGIALLLSILCGAFFVAPLSVLAQSTGSAPNNPPTANTPVTDPYCQQYLQVLARRLNIPVNTFEQDTLAAKEDVLAQLLKDRKLTQSQANTLKQRLISRQVCSGKDKNWRNQNVLRSTLQKYQGTLISLVAQGLHIDSALLQSDLQNGQTLSEISKGQNISRNQLSTLVLNSVHSTLDQAQKASDLTPQQASGLLQYLRQRPNLVKNWLHHVFVKKQHTV